jgi:tetratricopeptide (TPR) repeat protein
MKLAPQIIEPLDVAGLLRGGIVTSTGRLASMTHEEFVQLIESYGGRWSPAVRDEDDIALLVVGQQDWPLTREGMLTQALRDAHAIAHRKSDLVVLSEERFLDGLGLESARENVHRLYPIAALTELLKVSRERIRAWVKAGLITPTQTNGGVWHFDFRDVSAAKTLCELARSGVSTARLRESLEQLRKWIPDVSQPLQQLSIIEQDGDLLVRLERGDLAQTDGQLRLEFSAEVETSSLRLVQPGPSTASEWTAQAVEQEQAGYLTEAAESYRQALRSGGPDARICFDLASLLHRSGELQSSAERYRQATEIDPKFADAWNNLGAVLTEGNQHEAACEAFRRALSIDPNDARAHYNLADALEDIGCTEEAADHWRAYLRFEGQGQWAAYARKRLASGGP